MRNHLPVPEVDPDEYELEITGVGLETKIFSLEDLKKMPRYTVTSTVMCAGNRRSEMSQVFYPLLICCDYNVLGLT